MMVIKPPFTCPTEKAVFILYNNLRKRFLFLIKNLFLRDVFRVELVGVLNRLLPLELEAESRLAFFRRWSDVDRDVVPL